MIPYGISERDETLIRTTLAMQVGSGVMECLEWGSGWSTVHFPSLMAKESVPFRWVAIEHDAVWRDRVVSHSTPAQVELVSHAGDAHREPMDDYVNFPLKMGRRFNFVFVDGRKRRRCLITASKLLAVGGVVMLHDAERTYYHSAFDHFSRHERIGDQLWRGWVDL